MKVKLLRDIGADKKGDVLDVEDGKGNYWLQMGIVEDTGGKQKVSKPPAKTASQKSPSKKGK